MSGMLGYTLQGVDVEITKALRGLNADAIMRGRVAQGEWEYLEASEGTKMDVVRLWHEYALPLLEKNGKEKGRAWVGW